MEATIDRCDMDIEGPGDFADGLSFLFNEMASESALIQAQFGRSVERDVVCLGGTPSFLGSYGNRWALKLRDAREDDEHRAPGRRRRRPRIPQQIEVQRISPRSSLRCAHTRVAELHAVGSTALAYVSTPFLSHVRSITYQAHVGRTLAPFVGDPASSPVFDVALEPVPQSSAVPTGLFRGPDPTG